MSARHNIRMNDWESSHRFAITSHFDHAHDFLNDPVNDSSDLSTNLSNTISLLSDIIILSSNYSLESHGPMIDSDVFPNSLAQNLSQMDSSVTGHAGHDRMDDSLPEEMTASTSEA